MKHSYLNLPIRILFFIILLCSIGFGKIFHGAGMQMTNNGTGVYYKPGIPLNDDLQVLADIGIHFDNSHQSLRIFGSENQYRSVFFDITAGIRRELFKETIVGTFRPVIILQCGSLADMNSFDWNDVPGNWKLKYAAGSGIQFYNGRILNEIMLKYYESSAFDGNVAFQLAMYWK